MLNVLDTIGVDACLPEEIVNIVGSVINIIQFGIPIILVIMGMLDLGKAVTSQKEDEIKKAQSMLIKRIIYGVIVFLIPAIIEFAFGLLSDDGTSALGCMKVILEV
ncbi:MAG: hypothetical protein PHD02_01615 [Bacilli bacterium]|nr:hypothetical protein [Bacilli bacterium]